MKRIERLDGMLNKECNKMRLAAKELKRDYVAENKAIRIFNLITKLTSKGDK